MYNKIVSYLEKQESNLIHQMQILRELSDESILELFSKELDEKYDEGYDEGYSNAEDEYQ